MQMFLFVLTRSDVLFSSGNFVTFHGKHFSSLTKSAAPKGSSSSNNNDNKRYL